MPEMIEQNPGFSGDKKQDRVLWWKETSVKSLQNIQARGSNTCLKGQIELLHTDSVALGKEVDE